MAQPRLTLAEGAGEDEELANEAAQDGQADHGQRGEDEERGCRGSLAGQAAISVDLAGRVAVVEDAEQEEERAIDDAVRKDLVDRAGRADDREAVDAENDEAQVADGGKGDQLPEVALDQCQAGSVENANDGQGDELGSRGAGLHREQADVEAQHGVEAELAGDHHGQGDGGFRVRVGEPAVQREDGHLDRKGEEKRERCPEERAGRELAVGDEGLQGGEVEAAGARRRARGWRPAAAPRE